MRRGFRVTHNLPDGWRKRYITDITGINKHTIDKSFTHNKIEYIDISSVKEGKLNGKTQYVLSEAPSRAKRIVKHDDVIISTVRPNLRAFYYFDNPIDNLIVSTGFTVLSPSNTLCGKYLYYNVINKEFTRYLTSLAKGASYPAVDSKIIGNWQIPLPPLDIQKKIACVLDKADTLRELRKQANDKLDDFLQAVFLDMFGDPVTNPKAIAKTELCQVTDIQRGRFSPRPRNDPQYYGGNIPFIQTGNIANSSTYITSHHQTLNKKGLKVSKLFKAGTIALTIAAIIGETGILSYDMCFPDSIVGINPTSDKITIEFLEYQLRFFKSILYQTATETAQKNINLQYLRPLKVILPPLKLQNDFSRIVEQIEKQKEKNRIATLKLDDLFQSLLQKAFKGELAFNEDSFKEL
ncbi:MAG: hypothetical protein IEMM0008_1510 [bacterium]|nr:MAG: hypothetical protein IEMM0008_1510 [bacterium]